MVGFPLKTNASGKDCILALSRADTFAFNHPGVRVLVGDIQNYSDDFLLEMFNDQKPDIILGGPPCQGYSICNKNAGDPKDPRNTLFIEFLRLAVCRRSQFRPENDLLPPVIRP